MTVGRGGTLATHEKKTVGGGGQRIWSRRSGRIAWADRAAAPILTMPRIACRVPPGDANVNDFSRAVSTDILIFPARVLAGYGSGTVQRQLLTRESIPALLLEGADDLN